MALLFIIMDHQNNATHNTIYEEVKVIPELSPNTRQLWWLIWMRIRLVIRRLQVPSPPGQQHFFVEVDLEIFSMVILSLPLIQEGQLSVSGERMCTILANSLED